jgi:hypothetical protein
MPPSNYPPPEDVFRLMMELRDKIVDRFLLLGIPTAEAKARLEAALWELLFRWDRVGDREQWLLNALEREAPKPTIPGKEH